MNVLLRSALATAGLAFAAQAAAQVVLYSDEGFQGRSMTADREIVNLDRYGFNDRASSIVVLSDRWEVCEDAGFAGRCAVLRPGRYPTLTALGMNDRISSLRAVGRSARVDTQRYAPEPIPVYDNHRRNNERVFEANVTSVHAVFGAPQQRCWMEHQQVEDRGGANVPGAVVGALLGGVLGHQVGNGRGQDLATVGGAVAGAALGANVGRNGQQGYTQDVKRCAETQGQAQPEYWDVTYNFRGKEHRMQTAAPPGPTVMVNQQGEPRV